MDAPVTVTVYDKAFARKGTIGSPRSVVATVRHNALGTATLVVDDDHPRAADLVADGARVALTYKGDHLLSGQVQSWSWDMTSGAFTVAVADYWQVLRAVLGWAVPGASLAAQSVAYDVRTGPAETVVKALVAANATRLGLPVTVAPDLGRGGPVEASLRFHPLADRLLPAVDLAHIGVTVRQVGAGLVVDCYETTTYPRTLTDVSGVIQAATVTRTAPTVTRVVAGSQGEAEARVFFGPLIDAAREAEWGMVAEAFVDARDTDDPAVVTTRMQERLDEGAATSGLSMSLSETDVFRFGPALPLGSVVTAKVGPGLLVTDVLREAEVSWTVGDGLLTTPMVGARTDDPTLVVAGALAGVARDLRDLRTR